MDDYRARSQVPELVERAQALVAQHGFTRSSLPEVGRLLSVLAASVVRGRVGEIGTGCGFGAAWIASALPASASFYTIDIYAPYVDAVRSLFADRPNVHVLHGDWRELRRHGPFQLLFADGGKSKQEHETVLDMVALGGMIVLDDLTPEEYWPEEWRGQPDTLRQFWLNSDRVAATELRLTERHAVILATRIR
jgi:predicted O-methyltransferase YrrM